jgi:hypothetical protein
MMKTLFLLLLLLTGQTIVAQFAVNDGQIIDQHGKTNQEVLYWFNDGGLAMALTSQGFNYYVYTKQENGDVQVNRIEVSFRDPSPQMKIAAFGQKNTINRYLLAGPQMVNERMVDSVLYYNVWPGVDMVFKTREDRTLEYDFYTVSSDQLASIGFEVNGATVSEKNQQLVYSLDNLPLLTESIPKAWVESGEVVDIHYRLTDEGWGLYGKALPKDQKLIIDPIPQLAYSTYVAGDSSFITYNMCHSPDGFIYSLGSTNSTNIATSGAYQETIVDDGFLAAFIRKSNEYMYPEWCTYVSVAGNLGLRGCAFTEEGLFVLGGSGTSGLATPGAFQESVSGESDGIIMSFSTAGQLNWCTYFGGSQAEQSTRLAAMDGGYLILGGQTRSPDFPQIGPNSLGYQGNWDLFFMKLDQTTGSVESSVCVGGAQSETMRALSINEENRIFVVIGAESERFGPSPYVPASFLSDLTPWSLSSVIELNGDLQLLNQFYQDKWIIDRLAPLPNGGWVTAGTVSSSFTFIHENGFMPEPTGSHSIVLVWVDAAFNYIGGTYFGGEDLDSFGPGGGDIDVDSNGNLVLLAETSSEGLSTPGVPQENINLFDDGNQFYGDLVLASFANHQTLNWCTYWGDNQREFPMTLLCYGSRIAFCSLLLNRSSIPDAPNSPIVTPGSYMEQTSTSGSVTNYVIFDLVASVAENTTLTTINQVFPNPAEDQVWLPIESGNSWSYEVINTSGQLVLNGTTLEASLSVASLPPGVYLLRWRNLENEKISSSAKFIKR